MTKKLYVVTGAGLSAASGIPTFRDTGGLWHNFDINEVCNYPTWRMNYEKVHDFYNARRADLAKVEPNEAHRMIAEWQTKFGACNVVNITTNVDDLLQRAGVVDVVQLHGDLTSVRHVHTEEVIQLGYEHYDKSNVDVKPNVVFFGEYAPEYQTLHELTHRMTKDDMVIYIGMSFNVIPSYMCVPVNVGRIPISINVNPDITTNGDTVFDVCINTEVVYAVPRLNAMVEEFFR